MRIRVATLLAIIMVLLGVAASAQNKDPDKDKNQWAEFKAPDQGFAISFPGTPGVKSQPIAGANHLTQYYYQVDLDSDHTFLTSVLEFPAGDGPHVDDAYYTRMLDAYSSGSGSVLRTRTDTKIGGHNCVEAVFDDPSGKGNVALFDVMVFGDRIYMVISIGLKGHEASASALRFRNSFRILSR